MELPYLDYSSSENTWNWVNKRGILHFSYDIQVSLCIFIIHQ